MAVRQLRFQIEHSGLFQMSETVKPATQRNIPGDQNPRNNGCLL
jgi:hypothetical protein